MRLVLPLLVLVLLELPVAGCGPRNTGQFSDDNPRNSGAPQQAQSSGLIVTRQETADQGSGMAGSASYSARRNTVGGSYLRRTGVAAGSYRANAGLYGNPGATR